MARNTTLESFLDGKIQEFNAARQTESLEPLSPQDIADTLAGLLDALPTPTPRPELTEADRAYLGWKAGKDNHGRDWANRHHARTPL